MDPRAEALKTLGLDRAPDARIPGLWEQDAPPPGRAMLHFKKALQLVDPIETAAFAKYIPDGVVIDQEMDARQFHRDYSKCVMLRTDQPIPSNRRVFAATGIGTEPNAHNHYLWLAQELGRHFLEMGAAAIAPPLLFRTSGADGTVPFLGLVMKLKVKRTDGADALDGGANWALMGPRSPKIELEGDESISDVK